MRRAIRTALSGVLLALLLPLTGVSAHAVVVLPEKKAAVVSGADEALFNSVRGSKKGQDALLTRAKRVINRAPKGTKILIVMFLFDRVDVAERLLAAVDRGVTVKLLGDRHMAKKRPYKMLKKRLKSKATIYKPLYEGQLMHEKYMLATYPGGKNQLLIGSNNFSQRNASKEWNDLLVLKNIPKKAVEFLRHEFRKLKAGELGATAGEKVSSGKIALFSTPTTEGSLYLSEMLDHVKCKGSARLALATLHFGDSRVAEKLWRLQNTGCKVRVMINYDAKHPDKDGVGTSTLKWLRKATKHGRIALYNSQRPGAVKNHFKFLVLKGYFDGKKQGVVWTGSLHPSAGSQQNAQLQVRVKSTQLANRYESQFSRMVEEGWASRI